MPAGRPNLPKSWYDYGADYMPEQRVSIDVEEYGPRTIDTGILDADGNPIRRTEQRRHIGFWRMEDQDNGRVGPA